MIFRTMALLVSCLALLLGGTNARATDSFDVRDHLPLGDLFCFPNGLSINWSGEEILLEDTLEEQRFSGEIIQGLDNSGRLVFSSKISSDEGNSAFIKGTIDVSAAGRPFIEIDIWYPDGTNEAFRATQIEIGNPRYLSVKECDCADNLTFGCTNNKCNDGDKCLKPPSNGDYKCRWAAGNIIINSNVEEADD